MYSHHRDAPVGRLKTITTAANCYRNESHYLGLRRLKSFSMREIVFIGEMEPVTRALGLARGRVHDLAGALGVETRLENAMDPFFDPNSTRAVTQKMFPTKQEMVYGDDLAISSSNFHRNFFGQRFNISSVDGQTAYTACIGMGLERWIHAMLEVYGNDIERAIARLEALEDELASASEADAAWPEPRSPGPPCPTLPARPSSSSSIPSAAAPNCASAAPKRPICWTRASSPP